MFSAILGLIWLYWSDFGCLGPNLAVFVRFWVFTHFGATSGVFFEIFGEIWVFQGLVGCFGAKFGCFRANFDVLGPIFGVLWLPWG